MRILINNIERGLLLQCNILFSAGSLSSSDLVAFLSGLLLGEDTKAKNWFSSFVRIGQRVSILNVLGIAIFCTAI